jgi:hypothetical protein
LLKLRLDVSQATVGVSGTALQGRPDSAQLSANHLTDRAAIDLFVVLILYTQIVLDSDRGKLIDFRSE